MRRVRAQPLALVVALSLAACTAPQRAPVARDPEPARARAALAALHVVNASPHALRISYRHTTRAAAEVGVGSVPARASALIAPVPAGEPIVLIARTAADGRLVLAARTFDVQGSWLWRIPADAQFIPPGDDG